VGLEAWEDGPTVEVDGAWEAAIVARVSSEVDVQGAAIAIEPNEIRRYREQRWEVTAHRTISKSM
jgi:hypothetical protein